MRHGRLAPYRGVGPLWATSPPNGTQAIYAYAPTANPGPPPGGTGQCENPSPHGMGHLMDGRSRDNFSHDRTGWIWPIPADDDVRQRTFRRPSAFERSDRLETTLFCRSCSGEADIRGLCRKVSSLPLRHDFSILSHIRHAVQIGHSRAGSLPTRTRNMTSSTSATPRARRG